MSNTNPMHIALFEPEIPPNTGNIIRLCANCGATLHLIHPLGFDLNEKSCRRAGLDYKQWTGIQEYENYADFAQRQQHRRILACTTKSKHHHSDFVFQADDILLLGPETRGLPEGIRQQIPEQQWLRIPMLPHSRSLNLANAASILIYEMWRQLGYPNAQYDH